MTMATDGKAPGPIRFYLVCDRPGCGTRTTFDVVVEDAGPSLEDDLWGHITHRATAGAPRAAELGWTYLQGDGHWCPRCSDPVDRAEGGR
ncbi:hypothetical protein GCM10027168_02800 [Streptomyces capparidis]